MRRLHSPDEHEVFQSFAARVEPLVRRSLVARFGAEVASEAATVALAETWRRWRHITDNPEGYAYRIASRWAQREVSKRTREVPVASHPAGGRPHLSPAAPPRTSFSQTVVDDLELHDAMAQLSERQREVVLLVKGWGYSYQEVAELLEISESTMRSHLERGLGRLRELLEDSEANHER